MARQFGIFKLREPPDSSPPPVRVFDASGRELFLRPGSSGINQPAVSTRPNSEAEEIETAPTGVHVLQQPALADDLLPD
jgi:hypothetical protein